MDTTDQENAADLVLLQAVQAGDPQATDAFIERMRCIPRILAAKNKRMGRALPQEEMADLAQDVFSSIWKRADQFAGHSSLEAWVSQFCLFTYMNAYRKRQRSRARLSFDSDLHEVKAPSAVESPGDGIAQSALNAIEPPVSTIIRLREIDGLPFATIASELGLPLGTTKSHYYRGLERMRDILRTQYGMTELQ